MTPEDLAQITAIVRDETAAAEQRNAERLGRAMEALTANLSEVREELKGGLAAVTIRLDTLERRFESFNLTLILVEQRMMGLLKQSDRLERDNGAMLANDAAQQRAPLMPWSPGWPSSNASSTPVSSDARGLKYAGAKARQCRASLAAPLSSSARAAGADKVPAQLREDLQFLAWESLNLIPVRQLK